MWNSFAAAENSIQTVFSALHGQRNNDEAIQNLKLPKLFAGTTAMAAYKGTSSKVFIPILQLTDGKMTPGKCPGPFPSEIEEVNLNMKMEATNSWHTKKFIKCYNCFTGTSGGDAILKSSSHSGSLPHNCINIRIINHSGAISLITWTDAQ